jgi:hypothetical protein
MTSSPSTELSTSEVGKKLAMVFCTSSILVPPPYSITCNVEKLCNQGYNNAGKWLLISHKINNGAVDFLIQIQTRSNIRNSNILQRQ